MRTDVEMFSSGKFIYILSLKIASPLILFLFFLRNSLDLLSLSLLKIYLFTFLKFLVVLSLRCCTQAFSSCGEQGLLLFRSMASRCVGFSSWGSWALQCGLSRHMGLVASSQTRDRTHVPCIGRQILNH